MTEPTTETGKQLLASDFDTTGWGPRVVREHVTKAVIAIEQEAAAAERERLRERWDSFAVIDVVERKGWSAGVMALLADPEPDHD